MIFVLKGEVMLMCDNLIKDYIKEQKKQSSKKYSKTKFSFINDSKSMLLNDQHLKTMSFKLTGEII